MKGSFDPYRGCTPQFEKHCPKEIFYFYIIYTTWLCESTSNLVFPRKNKIVILIIIRLGIKFSSICFLILHEGLGSFSCTTKENFLICKVQISSLCTSLFSSHLFYNTYVYTQVNDINVLIYTDIYISIYYVKFSLLLYVNIKKRHDQCYI